MNGFDILILGLAGLLALVGAWKGILRLGLGAAGLILGLVLAVRFEAAGAAVVGKLVEDDLWARLLAFIAIVVAVSMGAVVLSWLLRRMLRTVRLVWADRLLGAAAGVLCAVLLTGALALILSTAVESKSGVLEKSRLAPYALVISRGLAKVAPADVRRKFREQMKRLSG